MSDSATDKTPKKRPRKDIGPFVKTSGSKKASDDAPDVIAATTTQLPPYFQFKVKPLPVSELFANHAAYQRACNEARVSGIAASFHPLQVVMPIVAPVGLHRYEILDGQHTIKVLMSLGVEVIDVRVIDQPTTPAERAMLFTGYNNNGRKLDGQALYKSTLEWGEPIYTACEDVLNNHGLTGLHGRSNIEIRSVKTMRPAFGHAHEAVPNRVIHVDPSTLVYGRERLDWAIQTGKPLMTRHGLRAQDVFNRDILSGLIWIAQNCEDDDLPDPGPISEVLNTIGVNPLRKAAVGVLGGVVAKGGNSVAARGFNIARWVNKTARQELIVLNQASSAVLQFEAEVTLR